MKKLGNFENFDFNGFTKGKKYMSIGCQPWVDFATKRRIGTKVEVVITQDQTDYEISDSGNLVSNLYEKITFKVCKELNVPLNVEIQPKGVVAKVYGEYRNQLSVQADDIMIVSQK